MWLYINSVQMQRSIKNNVQVIEIIKMWVDVLNRIQKEINFSFEIFKK